MKFLSRSCLTAATIACSFSQAVHATEFRFDGQIRLRFEGMDSTFVAATASNSTVPLRTRLGVTAVIAENLQAVLQVQDSRLFGVEASTVSNDKNLDVHQAYGEVRSAWSSGEWRVRGGRQEWSYGSERIIGTTDWSNVGRVFDALHARLQQGGWTVDMAAARIAQLASGPNDTDDLFLSYNRYALPARDAAAEFYALYRDDSRGAFETTVGERLAGSGGRLRFEHELAYQMGRREQRDLGALLFSLQAHVRLAERGKPTLGAGFDYLSGDDLETEENEYFDVNRIFHTGHKFYGLMDVAERLAGTSGFLDPYAVLAFQGRHDLRATTTVHVFFLDTTSFPGGLQAADAGGHLGTEVDLVLGITPREKLRLELGGAVFVPGDEMRDRDQGATGSWAYVQATLGF